MDPKVNRPDRIPSRLQAIVTCQCPRCRQGDLFERPAYRIDSFSKMFPQCTHCGQDFKIEPGFYMAASYLGYGFTAVISVAGALGSIWLYPKMNTWLVIAMIVVVILVMLPLIFRVACSMILHGLAGIRFDAQAAQRTEMYVGEDGQLHVSRPAGSRAEPRNPASPGNQ